VTHVLVIDDSPTMRQLIAFALSRLPECQVDTAEDGLAGFKKLIAGQYDLIVTELNMPVLDGQKLLRLVRGDPNHREVPVVIVTNETDEDSRQRMLDAGAAEYLCKPVQAPSIVAVVRKLIGSED